MTVEQAAAAMDFHWGKVNEPALFECFGTDFHLFPSKALHLLASTLKSRNEGQVESLLSLCFRFGALDCLGESVPLLCQLLEEDFHQRHEDIARHLQLLKDPRSVDSLYQACFATLPYRDYDENENLARKCIWALHDIGTDAAFERLRQLAEDPRPLIAGYAKKRLS
jgi:hypothetical protein